MDSHPICRFSFKKSRLGSISPSPITSDRESMREPPFAAYWWTPVLSDSSGTTSPPTVDVSSASVMPHSAFVTWKHKARGKRRIRHNHTIDVGLGALTGRPFALTGARVPALSAALCSRWIYVSGGKQRFQAWAGETRKA